MGNNAPGSPVVTITTEIGRADLNTRREGMSHLLFTRLESRGPELEPWPYVLPQPSLTVCPGFWSRGHKLPSHSCLDTHRRRVPGGGFARWAPWTFLQLQCRPESCWNPRVQSRCPQTEPKYWELWGKTEGVRAVDKRSLGVVEASENSWWSLWGPCREVGTSRKSLGSRRCLRQCMGWRRCSILGNLSSAYLLSSPATTRWQRADTWGGRRVGWRIGKCPLSTDCNSHISDRHPQAGISITAKMI